MLAARVLRVDHPADENPGVADDEAARLEHQPATRFLYAGDDHLGEGGGRQRLLLAIVDAEAAPHVPDGDLVPLLAQLVNKRQPLLDPLAIRLRREDRRA